MTEERDIRLVALIDGRLPEGEAADLRASLAMDPGLQARLDALDVDLSNLPRQAEEVLRGAPSLPGALRRRGSLYGLAVAASVALALLLGGVLIGSRMADGEDWRDFAAAYHLLYQPETLAAPRQGDGGVAMVSDAFGRDLSPLVEVEGLDFRRAQILGWEGATLVQFAYLDATGRPVAVCVMEFDVGPAGLAMMSEDRHGLATTSFNAGSVQVLVIGPDGDTDTEALSRSIAARL